MSDDVGRVYSKEELSTAITNTIEYYQHTIDALRKTNQRLIDDADAIVEECYKKDIEMLKERLSLSYGEFASQKEKEAYDKFEEEHMHDRLTSRYNGGRAPYLIPTGTGVGTNLKVVCPICGESKDITDTEAW